MIYIYIFLLGTVFASFLNASVYRFGKKGNWKNKLISRSHCEHCKHELEWYELIPIISWVVLKGRCSKCKKSIDFIHPLSELFLGIAFLLIFLSYGLSLWHYVFLTILYCLSISDLKTQRISANLTHILLVLGVIFFILNYNAIAWLSIGYFILVATGITILNHFKKSFGFGDLLLLLFFALIFNPINYLTFLLLTLYIAAIFSLVLVSINRGTLKSYIPLLPFMLLAFLLARFINLNSLLFLN
ncbi:prepilin peptidase [bacterium]|nr:prepilin peptidase [bacterium]